MFDRNNSNLQTQKVCFFCHYNSSRKFFMKFIVVNDKGCHTSYKVPVSCFCFARICSLIMQLVRLERWQFVVCIRRHSVSGYQKTSTQNFLAFSTFLILFKTMPVILKVNDSRKRKKKLTFWGLYYHNFINCANRI